MRGVSIIKQRDWECAVGSNDIFVGTATGPTDVCGGATAATCSAGSSTFFVEYNSVEVSGGISDSLCLG